LTKYRHTPRGTNHLITIEARNLAKTFGKRTAIDNLSFSIKEGELYALLGDNGAGKTTTINMLTTLVKPSKGEFFICGYHGVQQAEKCKQMFGVMSQDVAIYQELTAHENLSFVANLYSMREPEASRRIDDLLDRAGLMDRSHDRAGEFSMGMQRKLAIAIAILHEPKVLFMDEPTVGLDPASRRQIWAALKSLRAHGVTILLTTHYLDEAELLADRIGIIRKGKLEVEGTIDELRHTIQSVRGVAVRLSHSFTSSEMAERLQNLKARLPVLARYDTIRNTINILPPEQVELNRCLSEVLLWLGNENISYSSLSTAEPSLEDLYLALSENSRIDPSRSESVPAASSMLAGDL
jgi:ABC-2 type transport system ATP-binding protein